MLLLLTSSPPSSFLAMIIPSTEVQIVRMTLLVLPHLYIRPVAVLVKIILIDVKIKESMANSFC